MPAVRRRDSTRGVSRAGTLPPGIGISASGQLNGTPTASGVYTFRIKVADTNNLSNAGYRQFTLNITPISFTASNTLPYATLNQPYNYTIPTSGGTAPVTYQLADGSSPLPTGLSLSSAGVIGGTPTVTGQFRFTVLVGDGANPSHTQLLTLYLSVWTSGPAVAISTGSNLGTLPIGQVQLQLTAAGGTGDLHMVSHQWRSAPRRDPCAQIKPHGFLRLLPRD